MAKRPLTAKEIEEIQNQEDDSGTLRVLNISKQLIKVHLRPPQGVDFFLAAQDVNLKPNQHYTFKKSRLWIEQIEKLSKIGKLQILHDSDAVKKKN